MYRESAMDLSHSRRPPRTLPLPRRSPGTTRTQLVIFDCDGVLVDSEPVVMRVLARKMTEAGVQTSHEDCLRDFVGLNEQATLDLIAERFGGPVPDTWLAELGVALSAALRREVTAVPGVTAALDRITTPVCVASNANHAKVRLTLSTAGLLDRFSGRIFSAADVVRGKPAPDLFLHAADSLGVAPANCVVVEDSDSGVAAARAAGMRVLGYAGGSLPQQLADADGVFSFMADLPALLGDSRR